MENFARRMEQGMPLKGAADSRLTEQSSGGRLGDTFFLGDHRKEAQEVQIDWSQFL